MLAQHSEEPVGERELRVGLVRVAAVLAGERRERAVPDDVVLEEPPERDGADLLVEVAELDERGVERGVERRGRG